MFPIQNIFWFWWGFFWFKCFPLPISPFSVKTFVNWSLRKLSFSLLFSLFFSLIFFPSQKNITQVPWHYMEVWLCPPPKDLNHPATPLLSPHVLQSLSSPILPYWVPMWWLPDNVLQKQYSWYSEHTKIRTFLLPAPLHVALSSTWNCLQYCNMYLSAGLNVLPQLHKLCLCFSVL